MKKMLWMGGTIASLSVAVILNSQTPVNTQRESARGTTALMWAAEQGHAPAAKALIDAGADVSIRSAGTGLPTPYMASTVLTLTPFDRAGGATIPQGGRYSAAAAASTLNANRSGK